MKKLTQRRKGAKILKAVLFWTSELTGLREARVFERVFSSAFSALRLCAFA